MRILTSNFTTHWQTEYLASPLRQRAWALQERELSPRVVHYSKDAVLWECKTIRATSEVPWVHEKKELEEPAKERERSMHHNKLKREHWFSVVQDYSERTLTYESDKLPGLGGLARLFYESVSKERYIAGLWSTAIPIALIWRTRALLWSKHPPRRPLIYRAPSWSWASIDGSVSYDLITMVADNAETTLPSNTLTSSFRILDTTVEAAGQDSFGHLRSGRMGVLGYLLPAIYRGSDYHGDNEFAPGGWRDLLNNEGELVGVLAPDVMPDNDLKENIFCLPMVPTLNWEADIGLALEEVKDDPIVYRRIGLVRIWPSAFRATQPREIIII